MHLAYLILAHSNPNQINRLVSKLNNSCVTIFIHLDSKVRDTERFKKAGSTLKNVHFIERRLPVNWGGYSMVQATLNGLDEILQSNSSVDYINLLSGTDYPVKNNQYILNFFTRHKGSEFIYNRQVPSFDLPLGGMDRIEYYYDYDNKSFDRDQYEKDMRVRGSKRTFIENITPYHGSQWWSITGECAKYILSFVSKNKEITNFYRYTKFADEQFFQTVVMNSPFSPHVVNENLRYIDWSYVNTAQIDWTQAPPHPKVLTVVDFQKIYKTNKLFARKFDEDADRKIIRLIDAHILK